jgi:hypothetical protein
VRPLTAGLLALSILTSPLLAACGGDDRPDDRAGADGAFGGADDCTELAEQAVAARARVLAEIGDARRDDVERIDAALESFGGEGTDLAVRYQGLGCDRAFEEAVCAASASLEAAGPAGQDLVRTWRRSCGPIPD